MYQERVPNTTTVVITDLFCDASVGPDLRGACSGVTMEMRGQPNMAVPHLLPEQPKGLSYAIQPTGTNNSGESMAVAMGVNLALSFHKSLREQYPYAFLHFNIFSDSLITINGVREWLPGWVKNSVGIALRNGRGDLVKNQEFFKFIYNSILRAPADFSVSFYHQDGHITKNYQCIEEPFFRRNGVTLEQIGIKAETICLANDFVDRHTRGYINDYLNNPKRGQYYNIHNMASGSYMETDILSADPNVIEQYKARVQKQLIMG